MTPRYPIYVISKGRHKNPLTAKFLIKDECPFHIVVEPQEKDAYAAALPGVSILELPFANLGLGSIPARNWVWEHAKAAGYERHWILDDNIRSVQRRYQGKRIPCDSRIAFCASEDFSDRYENVAILGLAYRFFVSDGVKLPPFYLNNHVYSCLLIQNDLPHRWRGRYNEDTDLCLQVLADGLCTILINAFVIDKIATMTMKGGNSDQLYQADGRLKMARSLERMWPGVVETKRRFKRPQHVVKDAWRRFDTPLKLKPGINLSELPKTNEYGMQLIQIKEPKSERLRALVRDSKTK
jgi:hypothetical protein